MIVVPLRDGAREDVEALLRQGPPVEVGDLERYAAFVTAQEAVLVLDGPDVGPTDGRPWRDPTAWRDGSRWAGCAAADPRIGEAAHVWTRSPDLQGVFFGPQPGPGDSEGGDPLAAGGAPPMP